MMLRKWRVARVNAQRKGGYDSPRTMYWTRRGACAAAEQLENLEPLQINGLTGALRGKVLIPWSPIRHRTLRGVQAHNIVMESGSYDRHPAGSVVTKHDELLDFTKKSRKPFHRDMTLAEYWLEGPGSELLRRFDTVMVAEPRKFNLCETSGECSGPYRMDGHCVHCNGPSDVLREHMNHEEMIGDDDRDGDGDVSSRATPL